MARDPLGAIVDFNRAFVGGGRDPAWLRGKLDRLCASPFGFLRGTFHLFAADWRAMGDDPFAPGADSPIVGDLHLENFGAYRAADGRFVFDVNDFDESANGPPALDLARVATSFLLADEKRGDARALERIAAFVAAYLGAARDRECGPVEGKGMPPAVKQLIGEAEDGSRAAWLARRVEGAAGARRFVDNVKYQPVDEPGLRAELSAAIVAFAAATRERPADCAAWPSVIDVATRVAGTGSLGRFRYALLMPGKGCAAGKELVLELKEARPSALEPLGDASAQADRVIANVRTLQGEPPAYLGRATVGGMPFTVRELQPTEAKLEVARLRGRDLDELCGACGVVLGRLHRRGSATLPTRLAGRDRAVGRRIAAFALRYAEVVAEDHAALVAGRAEVERALALSTTTPQQ
ncbi:MAG: hypothetical protein JWN44_721 [Myxococcales bacterium]|nr:hypothetical protein [Myxococcales bacterium]